MKLQPRQLMRSIPRPEVVAGRGDAGILII
jgi:hypothetical protein